MVKVTEKNIGKGLKITEFLLKSDSIPIEKKQLALTDYVRLYHDSDFIDVNGQKYPFILLGEFEGSEKQYINTLPDSYELPEQFKRFSDAIKSQGLAPGSFNGQSVGILDISFEDTIKIFAERVGYFDFMSMDLAQDADPSRFNDSLEKGKTLREYEIVDGKPVSLKDSHLTNLLGVGFVVYNKKEGYFIFEQRKAGLAVEGGTLGMLGGTPEWAKLLPYQGNFSAYILSHCRDEMKEELCLEPEEFELERGFWVRDLTRAPAIFACLTTEIPIEVLAERCALSEEALKEHTRILKIPANRETIYTLIGEDSDYNTNRPTIVGAELVLNSYSLD